MQEQDGNAQPRGALFRKAALRAALGNISERKFDALRAAGIIPDPIELGPRVSCWTQQDYETILARLPRREKAPEPETLATARRARIEALKSGSTRGAQ